MLSAKLSWKGGITFEGISKFGHKIITDGSKKAGGQESGYQPTELLLYSIAGCTGVDVIRILEKQRQNVTELTIEVIAHQREEYPKWFHTFEIKYIVKGKDIDSKKVEQAIELSEAKYCSVSQTVVHEAKVTTSYEIIPE